jgi:hypothetical protein
MSRQVVYLPEVSQDFFEAFAYYEALSPKAALGFEEAFGRAEAEIEEGLRTHQRVLATLFLPPVDTLPGAWRQRLHREEEARWRILTSITEGVAKRIGDLAIVQTHTSGRSAID